MSDDVKKKISDLIDKHHLKKETEQKVSGERQIVRNKFLEEFDIHAKEVIRPSMEELGELLVSKGLNYHISEMKDSALEFINHIVLNIFEYRDKPNYVNYSDYPYVSFSANRHDNCVHCFKNTIARNHGGSKEKYGKDYSIEEVQPALIESIVYKTLEELIGK